MNYLNIDDCEICNGEGVGCSLFVSGCKFHCKNCFNSSAWDFTSGIPFDNEAMQNFIKLSSKPYISRISFLGGEPLADGNYQEIEKLIPELPRKRIWLYTGYTLEELLEDEKRLPLLSMVDVLVDGRYVDELKDPSLKFRGSSNQRVLDCETSICKKKPVLYGFSA